MVSVFNNVGERCMAKNYRLVSLLFVAGKVFERLASDKIVDHLGKCGLFSHFEYGFRPSRLTSVLPRVVSNRIDWTLIDLWLLNL